MNINKDIGPNSLEILSYLRPEYEENGNNAHSGNDIENEDGSEDATMVNEKEHHEQNIEEDDNLED